MNKKLLGLIVLLVFGIVIWLISDPQENSINKFNISFNKLEIPSSQISSTEIYFDASTSMKGYFASGDGAMANVVSRFEKIATDTTKMFLIRKNNKEVPFSSLATSLQQNLSLFDGGSTHFEILIPKLAEKANEGKLSVLVTDGIVFIDKNASTALEQFQNLLSKQLKNKVKNKAVAIFKYSAKFKSTQVGPGGVCYYDMFDTPKKLDSDNRPFYVIAIGSIKDILALQNVADTDLKPELQFYVGLDPNGILQKVQSDPIKLQDVNTSDDWTIQMTFPKELSYINDEDFYYFKQNTKIEIGNKALKEEKDYKVEYSNGNSGLNVNITLINPSKTGVGIGNITYTLDNNIPASWLSLSVDNDSNSNTMLYKDKTFGIKYLLQGIKDAVVGNQPIVKAIINIQ